MRHHIVDHVVFEVNQSPISRMEPDELAQRVPALLSGELAPLHI